MTRFAFNVPDRLPELADAFTAGRVFTIRWTDGTARQFLSAGSRLVDGRITIDALPDPENEPLPPQYS